MNVSRRSFMRAALAVGVAGTFMAFTEETDFDRE